MPLLHEFRTGGAHAPGLGFYVCDPELGGE